jgi:hypothetical protein
LLDVIVEGTAEFTLTRTGVDTFLASIFCVEWCRCKKSAGGSATSGLSAHVWTNCMSKAEEVWIFEPSMSLYPLETFFP